MAARPPPAKKIKMKQNDSCSATPQTFSGIFSHIVEHGVGKVRCNILRKQLETRGAVVYNNAIDASLTHLFVSKDLRSEKLLSILKLKELGRTSYKILNVDWISACLVKGDLVKEDDYIKYAGGSFKKEEHETNKGEETVIKIKDVKNDEISKHVISEKPGPSASLRKAHARNDEEENNLTADSGISTAEEDNDIPALSTKSQSFVCSKPSTSKKSENLNKHITEKLEILLEQYTSTQDRWRAFGYKKAITSISKYYKRLETYEEVLKLPGVGDRLAKKVLEIIETGHLKRLDHIDPKVETLKLFSGVWGAGPKTAETWVARGFKKLSDLPENELTFQQKIGIKHYDDINEKMPRSEVAEFERMIRACAVALLPGVLLTVCGSYRRNRPMCGDIDILVSHPDGRLHQGFLFNLLNKLKEKKLITDDLIAVENDAQKKYMGMCRLPGEDSKFRRIDFIAAPYCEWPCALLHFTGSAHLNRSMRLLAKKKNMSLSEHALRRHVVRGPTGEKMNKGELVPVKSEADIFKHLELDYLEPHERDW